MNKTSYFNHLRCGLSAIALAAVVAVSPAMAQTTDGGYSRWDISPFIGWKWFQTGEHSAIRPLDFNSGPVFGAYVTEDVSRYIGIEEGLAVGLNNLRLLPGGYAANAGRVGLKSQNYSLDAALVFNLRPRGASWRPFIIAGPDATWYRPAKAPFTNVLGAVIPPNEPKTKVEPGVQFGVGIKHELNKKWGVRADLRDVLTKQPHYGLPESAVVPSEVYIPYGGWTNALQLTGGVTYSLGRYEPPPPVKPAPPPPPPPPPPAVTISAISGAHDVCPGDNLPLSVTAGGGASTPTLQWFVNGVAAAGATSSSFSLPTAGASGSRNVTVTATSGSDSKTSAPAAVRIKSSANPTVRFALSQQRIAYGDKLPLAATGTGSECTDPVRVTYTASEGSISGNTYDSSGVAFDMSNRLKEQCKTITITATATDSKNQSARQPQTVNVCLTPQATRYDDIVFQTNSARVNNCGKRILLEQVAPVLKSDPEAKVILIGHRDNGERVALKLDDKRIQNAAAILSAGKGICPDINLSRILVHAAGTDQTSQTRPALCGSSVQERSGAAIKDNDQKAQFRRVEVWVVPGGAAMPEGTSGFTSAPEKETKALACPK